MRYQEQPPINLETLLLETLPMYKSLSANKTRVSRGHIFRDSASVSLAGRQPARGKSPCLAKNLSRNPHTPYLWIGSKTEAWIISPNLKENVYQNCRN